MLELRVATANPWVTVVLDGFDDFLLDHAACERFGLIARALEKSSADSELTAFYANLSESEARHRDFFVDLAELYFDKDRVDSRLSEWLDDEARIVSELPISAALH